MTHGRPRRVVIVGSDFTPSSLPPAQRIRLFARHLPDFGWEPTVLTVDPSFYETAVDPENEQLLGARLDVVRTSALPARWTRRMGVGDLGIRSLVHHWRALAQLCRRGAVDLVFIPVPPFVPMILGRWAYERFGIPYVIDYIDPWVTDYRRRLSSAHRPLKWRLASRLARMVEPVALKRAAHIVGVSKGTTDGVLDRYAHLGASQATVIPYGGEPADFEHLRAHPRKHGMFEPHDGLLHVSYVGRGGVDMLPALRAVFQAMILGLRDSPEWFSRLRLHFVGTTYAPTADGLYQVMPLANELGVGKYVDEHPQRIPYLDTLQVMLDSHGLLLVGSDAPHYTASKVFPYILSGKPLLGVVHEASSIVTILREVRVGKVVTFSAERPPQDHSVEIMRSLGDMLAAREDGPHPASRAAFERYTARSMTERLAHVFDAVGRDGGRRGGRDE
jgi:hypothetical protein